MQSVFPGVQGAPQEQALPQLLTRLSGLVNNPPSASVAQAAEKAATNMSLLAPLARFHQAIQQENQDQVCPPACPVHQTRLAPLLHVRASLGLQAQRLTAAGVRVWPLGGI